MRVRMSVSVRVRVRVRDRARARVRVRVEQRAHHVERVCRERLPPRVAEGELGGVDAP